MRKFWFNGQCSKHFGLMASGSGAYNAPQRDVETISVAGRSGDLIRDNGRYLNISVSYPVIVFPGFAKNAAAVRAWLLSAGGYKRLEDDYNPDYFRLAQFKGPINFDVTDMCRAGEATLTFDCKPQRFLKAGEIPVTMDAEGVLRNPTLFPALPLITVYGTGPIALTVGDYVVGIQSLEDHICLDSDTQNAYRVGDGGALENKNGTIYAQDFPVLATGENTISWTGDLTKIEIIPRWWTL